MARAYPSDRGGVTALVAAARIQAKHLFQPETAAKLYREAQASPAPHNDLDAAIRTGLQELTPRPAGQPIASTYSR